MAREGPGQLFFGIVAEGKVSKSAISFARVATPQPWIFELFPFGGGHGSCTSKLFFKLFSSEIKLEIPWEFLIWWGSDLKIQGVESQDFVFWAFDPPPNGKFPGNFPFGGGSSGPPPNGKFFEFWILKSSK